MRCVIIPTLFAVLGLASSAYGEVSPAPELGAVDLFTISDIHVDATASSPRAARDLAMAQGRSLAWDTLVRRFSILGAGEDQPLLADNQLIGLIRNVEVRNERRNTIRYLARINYHFNPAAVRQFLRESNVASTEARSDLVLAIPLVANEVRLPFAFPPAPIQTTLASDFDDASRARLTVSVLFEGMDDWAKVRARLEDMKTVTSMDVVGLALNEAQIGLTYSGQMEQLRAALTQHGLALSGSGDDRTLGILTATAVNSP
jgi:hypothetical protein